VYTFSVSFKVPPDEQTSENSTFLLKLSCSYSPIFDSPALLQEREAPSQVGFVFSPYIICWLSLDLYFFLNKNGAMISSGGQIVTFQFKSLHWAHSSFWFFREK